MDVREQRFARLIRLGDPEREEVVVRRLERSRQELVGRTGAELEPARAEQEAAWRSRLSEPAGGRSRRRGRAAGAGRRVRRGRRRRRRAFRRDRREGLAVALQPELTTALPLEALAERATAWLAARQGWLLVLDNVDEVADVRPAPSPRDPAGWARERVLGHDHPDTLTSRNNLAAAYHAAGDVRRATPLLKRALAECERVLGPGHPTTTLVRANLRAVLRGRP
ncbi:tetratricopeptide repeat protein [Nonomuraea sp. NPDC004580]|uniref:tetratricopeptide repeat protein n=1 Tax=Nonomuraea sp. NPDC004580 TaxID=3154552 RepID=UPI0033BCCCA7